MSSVVGDGKYTYQVNQDWARIPEGVEMRAAAVAVDSQDRVYCFNRSEEHPVMVFASDGSYLRSWGAGQFEFPHAIYVDANDYVWLVDRNRGQIMKFTTDGDLQQTIGARGYRSDSGALELSSTAYTDVTRPGGPFNLPAGICVAPSGDIFIADGYGNCQVHRFSSDGQHLLSWGQPGTDPGGLTLPHGVWIDRRGRVLVAEREGDRVQVFSQEGEVPDIWETELIGPALFYVDDDDAVYIPEHNSGHTSIVTLDGERLARWGGPELKTCHGIWVDSHKDLYVVQPGDWGPGRRVVKFQRA